MTVSKAAMLSALLGLRPGVVRYHAAALIAAIGMLLPPD